MRSPAISLPVYRLGLDVCLVWRALVRATSLEAAARPRVATLAAHLAMDVRLRLRLAQLAGAPAPCADCMADLTAARETFQRSARDVAAELGLIGPARRPARPRGAQGEDLELWEWAPVDRAALEAVAQGELAQAARAGHPLEHGVHGWSDDDLDTPADAGAEEEEP
jgi:hypothetical protein